MRNCDMNNAIIQEQLLLCTHNFKHYNVYGTNVYLLNLVCLRLRYYIIYIIILCKLYINTLSPIIIV